MDKNPKKPSKFVIIGAVATLVSMCATLIAYFTTIFFLRRTTMKKEGKEKNIFFRTITLALVFSLILPFATLLYLFREVSAVNIIALAVNIIATIIVTICWRKEWKKNRS